jgi:hypothetical protein
MWIEPGMLIELRGGFEFGIFGIGMYQEININGDTKENLKCIYSDSPIVVLVVRVVEGRRYIHGLCKDRLYQFTGRFNIKQVSIDEQ